MKLLLLSFNNKGRSRTHVEQETTQKTPVDPHAAAPEENPEDHLGEVIRDPWDDPDQKGWTTASLDEVV